MIQRPSSKVAIDLRLTPAETIVSGTIAKLPAGVKVWMEREYIHLLSWQMLSMEEPCSSSKLQSSMNLIAADKAELAPDLQALRLNFSVLFLSAAGIFCV